MIYTDVWPFGLLLAHRLILVAQANLRIKKACINSQCFDFYLKRDVHVRLQRFTEKKLFSLLKKGNSWNKALCIIILSLIYSDTAFKMHGVKSVYWLKEHQGYQNDSIPRALYFRSFSSKYSWKKIHLAWWQVQSPVEEASNAYQIRRNWPENTLHLKNWDMYHWE